jgi:putative ABC transport system permease protein
VFSTGTVDPTFTVVGVMGDVRHTELEAEPFPQIFYPETGVDLDLVVRTSGDPLDVAPLVRAAVRQFDPGAAVSGVGRLSDRYRDGMAPRRFQTFMVGLLATFATLLAAVGLFAVLHDLVSARRREVGIRMALGAEPRRVLAMVLGSGLGMAAAGIALGLGLALLLSDVSARFVYGIESTDPLSFVSVAALLLATALVASGLPAWRATAVSPAETLNEE